jgi:dCMP deaminase
MVMVEFTNYSPPEWNPWFLQGVYWIASKSKDPRTKIGAILVKDKRILSTGYNGLPIGVNDAIEARSQRPEKYKWYEHGERNALYAAAKYGICTDGAILYTNALPCADCARGIIQSGIKEVYVHKQFSDICDMHQRDQWKGHDNATFTMFEESKVKVVQIDVVLGCKAYFDGKQYDV